MARPGDLVTVTATGAGDGPTDELTVGMNSHDPQGEYAVTVVVQPAE